MSIIHMDLKLLRVMTGVEVKKKVSQTGKSAVNTRATRSSVENCTKKHRKWNCLRVCNSKKAGNFQGKQEKW